MDSRATITRILQKRGGSADLGEAGTKVIVFALYDHGGCAKDDQSSQVKSGLLAIKVQSILMSAAASFNPSLDATKVEDQ